MPTVFDQVSYDLNLADDEPCLFHRGLSKTYRPICFGVSDRALFVLREKFLKLQAYSMERIPLDEIKEVTLSRERGVWVWLKWALVLAFGITSTTILVIGLQITPVIRPGPIATAGPVAFVIIALLMLIDRRWRLVLTVRTPRKDYRWRPHFFDKHDEVKALQEQFLAACRCVNVRTHRLDLVNLKEIDTFWTWFRSAFASAPPDFSLVQKRLENLCDRLDVAPGLSERELIITANYARDAFPIVEEIVAAAPKINDITIRAFTPRKTIGSSYEFKGVEYPLDNIFFISYTDGFELAIEIYTEWDAADEDFQVNCEFLWSLYRDLLGEYDVGVSVRYVTLRNLTKATDRTTLLPITELPAVVDDFHCFHEKDPVE
jgi:hypothetical protein